MRRRRDPSELPLVAFPGRLGWTKNADAYPLPAGIPDQLPVIVTKAAQGEYKIEVEDEAGTTYLLLWWQVEFPIVMTFPDSRREYTEWHPRVRELHGKHLEEYRAAIGRLQGSSILDAERAIKALEWKLERSSQPHPMAGRKIRRKG